MQRKVAFDYIEERLTILSCRVKNRGKLNILDVHLHSENFYRDLLNILYNWNLQNANNQIQNVEAIDLIDEKQKIIVQVSSTSTKVKIDKSINKKSISEYAQKGYRFKFVSIADNADDLRKQTYNNTYDIQFEPKVDIIDISSIVKDVFNLKIVNMQKVYDFIKVELGNMPDSMQFNSDLTMIINILADVEFDNKEQLGNINMYQIDKKIEFNNLDIASMIIDDYRIYYNQVDKKYKEFDKMGLNKSMFVLQTLKKLYIDALVKHRYDNNDLLFMGLIDETKEIVLQSKNYVDISKEALETCISILIVDAFMRCKIFKNPEGYEYVIT